MNGFGDLVNSVSPREVLAEIVDAVPEECKEHMIIIGSLAVGYHFFVENENMVVRTKDADCLLSPRVEAVPAGKAITEQLLGSGWRLSKAGGWGRPGDANTQRDDLPVVRLHPPDKDDWFIELLTVPENAAVRERQFERLQTSYGDFGLPSFGYLSLTNYEPISTDLGIFVAQPSLMALANMLEHPEIGPELMSGLIGGRRIRRSNKDLGRVLAIAYLSAGQDADSLEQWPSVWQAALQSRFEDWRELAQNVGAGIRVLLNSPPDLEEAYHTCRFGLLASKPPTVEQLRIAGERLLQDAVVPLEEMGN